MRQPAPTGTNNEIDPEKPAPYPRSIKKNKRPFLFHLLYTEHQAGAIMVAHFTGLRWHLRAWCEKNQDYQDFALSRFRGKPEIEGDSDRGIDDDEP